MLEVDARGSSCQVIAHRGASRARRENTLAAFEHAIGLGADAIELDVRRTRDRSLVVHHDAEVEGLGAVAELDRQDLPSHIPSLEEALGACGALAVNVEIKNSRRSRHYDRRMAVVDGVVAVLAERMTQGYSISSFDLPTVDAARDPAGRWSTGYLVARGDPTIVLDRAVAHGHQAVHPADLLVDEVFVAQAHLRGLRVNVWTVDEPSRMNTLLGYGVDGIITNVPDVARSVVDDRSADRGTLDPRGNDQP